MKTSNRFSLKLAQKLRSSMKTYLRSLLKTNFMEQPSGNKLGFLGGRTAIFKKTVFLLTKVKVNFINQMYISEIGRQPRDSRFGFLGYLESL